MSLADILLSVGPVMTLYVAGILSVNLGVVNILPFPPLDGGRMFVLVLKRLFGARVSLRAERLTYAVGFVVLMAFIIWISAFDIANLGTHRHDGGRDERPGGSAPGRAGCRGRAGPRRARRGEPVTVDVGGVPVGCGHPVVVQSMTNTDTADADGDRAPGRAPRPRRAASWSGSRSTTTPPRRPCRRCSASSATSASASRSIGDFHYNGHQLLVEYPEMARGAREVPHQPGQRRRASATTRTSRPSSGSRSRTTSRSASASTGARSTRRC